MRHLLMRRVTVSLAVIMLVAGLGTLPVAAQNPITAAREAFRKAQEEVKKKQEEAQRQKEQQGKHTCCSATGCCSARRRPERTAASDLAAPANLPPSTAKIERTNPRAAPGRLLVLCQPTRCARRHGGPQR